MQIVNKIKKSRLWVKMIDIQKIIMVICTASIIIMLGLVVVSRNVFHFNVQGYDEIVLVGAFWMYFIGAGYGMYKQSHITADFLSMYLSNKNILKLKIISRIIQIIIGIPLMYLSFEMLLFDIDSNPTTLGWQIPLLIPQSAIFIGYSLMTFYTTVYLFDDIDKLNNQIF